MVTISISLPMSVNEALSYIPFYMKPFWTAASTDDLLLFILCGHITFLKHTFIMTQIYVTIGLLISFLQ